MKYVAVHHSESGDTYYIGPFDVVPSFDDVAVHLPLEEWDFLKENAEDLTPTFGLLEVLEIPGRMRVSHTISME